MKKFFLGLMIGFSGAALIFNTSSVYAKKIETNISALFNSITVMVNGKHVDTDNFNYKGVTYVPLRSISELLGKEIDWDNENKIVNIGEKLPEKENQNPPLTAEEYGNTASNLANGGLIAGNEDWVYLSYKESLAASSTKDGLYKMKPDGTKQIKIASNAATYLNLDSNNIYFVDNGIYELNLNNNQLQKLSSSGTRLILAGEWLYYNDASNRIYKMKKDGSQKQSLIQNGTLINVVNNDLFFMRKNILFKTNVSNPQEQKLYTFSGETILEPIIQNGKIYFHDHGSVYSMNFDTSDKKVIYQSEKNNIFSLNVDNKFILLNEGNDGNHGQKMMVKLTLDGEGKEAIGESGLKLYSTPNHYYVTDLSAGYNEWYYMDGNKRTSIHIN